MVFIRIGKTSQFNATALFCVAVYGLHPASLSIEHSIKTGRRLYEISNAAYLHRHAHPCRLQPYDSRNHLEAPATGSIGEDSTGDPAAECQSEAGSGPGVTVAGDADGRSHSRAEEYSISVARAVHRGESSPGN